jgi:hypothetical protein
MAVGRHKHLNQALMRIARRAESTDRYTLATTYVAAGSFAAVLNSTDHQILYGRRGTGKTHALLYLSDLIESAGDVFVYLDLRTVGSAGGLYADSALSRSVRGTQLLVDTIEAMHDALLGVALYRDVPDQDGLLRALDQLVDAATSVEVVGRTERETTVGGSAGTRTGAYLSLSTGPAASLSASRHQSISAQERLRRTGVEQHSLLFGRLGRALRATADALRPARLWLLLDEWSSVPLDLQPLLADLLRRTVLTVAGITVKIGAIERRSQFQIPSANGDYVGIEVGADAASAVSLDDFMIFDHARTRAEEFFGQLFHNHASTELSQMIRDPPAEPAAFVAEVFRGNAFAELVRAAEGIPRDAINIAALAAQHAHDEPIGLSDVRRAARDWYLRDKQAAINTNEQARQLLQALVNEVVGRRRSRTFVIDQSTGGRDAIIDTLYDARLLHVLRRGLVDHHNPGKLYDGFAVDYGCYVALLLDGDLHFRPRDRGNWLSSPKSMPPEDFSFAKTEIDLYKLDN